MDIAADPSGLDELALRAPVRRCLGNDAVEIVDWRAQPLAWVSMDPSARAIHRVSGSAVDRGGVRPWSLVLKVARSKSQSDDPRHWNYWKREFLAYESGMLAEVPGPLAAPRCFGIQDHENEQRGVRIWLEDVIETQPRWSVSRYAQAARHLGSFNGAYLTSYAAPSYPWLTRHYLRSWVEFVADRMHAVVAADETWTLRAARRALRGIPVARLLRLHRGRTALLSALERLPQTLCHLDAWRSNLISRRRADGAEDTVAVDWSFVGFGPAGQDLGILVGGSHVWLDADPSEIEELSESTYAAYEAGLDDAGLRTDERMLRFAYTASAALHTGMVLPCWLPLLDEPGRREWLERKFRRDLDDVPELWGRALSFMLDLSDEALNMLEAGLFR